ncbi:hypothetical protein niasHT_022752 [Heterodera trifolii]|uniref:Cystatin domain-containing protein n=1 Tax=Heterodera trifolii TaxID=157864 RepID=A0ABD2K657_9BILA
MLKIFVLFNAFLLIKFVITHEGRKIGEPLERDVNSKEIKALASRAVDKINQQTNNTFLFVPVNVISAKEIPVAGVRYELRILVGKSKCMKKQPKAKRANCATETVPAERKIFQVSVFQQSWKNVENITFIPEEQMGNSTKNCG